jgi:hypothetical protein
LLLAVALAGKRLLDALLLARLQVVGVALDLFDDVLLLNLPLEAAQRTLYRLAILDRDFSQIPFTSSRFGETHPSPAEAGYVSSYPGSQSACRAGSGLLARARLPPSPDRNLRIFAIRAKEMQRNFRSVITRIEGAWI